MTRQWWHDKVAYQIYPKSFCDSNGDGIGDLKGIQSRLDYLKALGVDILWISPCYPSPLADQGYDISDYYDIDPRFGTLQDMDALIAEAKRRDMVILMDLVVNHCSDEHEWFKRACEDPDGKYGKYFYIVDRDPSGRLPCNWRSYFGGSCWEPLPGHPDKLYLHVFHKKQPDLNWENPEVRDEVCKNVNWWLDRGIGGFRIDAIINIKKKLPFSDYPTNRADGLSDIGQMLAEATGIGAFLGELRDRAFAPHAAFTVGEVFNEKDEELKDFIGENGYFSSMFDFSGTVFGASPLGWHAHTPITPEDYKRCVFGAQKRIGSIGFLSNIIENHDEPRGVSHYLPPEGRTDAGKKCLATAYFMLRGIPFIYQGQELGMENVPIESIDQVDDIASRDQYRVALDAGCTEAEALEAVRHFSRDNARTPMQWSAAPNAGFTAGQPWLPVNPNYRTVNAEAQQADPDSIFNYYRRLIALRKNPELRETLVYGALIPACEDQQGLLAYHRRADRDLLVLANLQSEARQVKLPGPAKRVLLNNLEALDLEGDSLTLTGWQAVILEM